MLRKVCSVDDVWDGELIPCDVGTRRIVLVNVDGDFSAFDARCPHQDQSLAEGELAGHVLTCPAHRWSFDVRSGDGINPTGCRLTMYPLRIEGEEVFVDVDATDAPVQAGERSA